MEVVSKLPNSGSRQDFLSKFIVDETANVCPIRVRVHKAVRASSRAHASDILVDRDTRVVRSEGFETSEVDSETSSPGRTNGVRDEEEKDDGDEQDKRGGAGGNGDEDEDGNYYREEEEGGCWG